MFKVTTSELWRLMCGHAPFLQAPPHGDVTTPSAAAAQTESQTETNFSSQRRRRRRRRKWPTQPAAAALTLHHHHPTTPLPHSETSLTQVGLTCSTVTFRSCAMSKSPEQLLDGPLGELKVHLLTVNHISQSSFNRCSVVTETADLCWLVSVHRVINKEVISELTLC